MSSNFVSKFINNDLDCYYFINFKGYKHIVGRNENYKCDKYDKDITASITPKRAEKIIYRHEKEIYKKKYKKR